jgi:predicted esterase
LKAYLLILLCIFPLVSPFGIWGPKEVQVTVDGNVGYLYQKWFSQSLIVYIGGGMANIVNPSYRENGRVKALGSINSTGVEPEKGEKEFIEWLKTFPADLLYIKRYYTDGYDRGNFVMKMVKATNKRYLSINLIGFSGGGVVVALLIEQYHFERAVIISAPLYWFPQEYYDDFMEKNIFRCAKDAGKINTPTMLVYGLKDKVALPEYSATKFLEKAPKKLVVLKFYDCGHTIFNDPESAKKIRWDIWFFFYRQRFVIYNYSENIAKVEASCSPLSEQLYALQHISG